LLQAWIDLLERNARGTNQQRKGHYSERDQDAAPRERDVSAEVPIKESADCAALSEDFQQDQASGDRRHHERQRNDCFNNGFTGPIVPREQPRCGEAERQDQERAEHGYPRREPEKLPLR
jgi:hypothetical protein